MNSEPDTTLAERLHQLLHTKALCTPEELRERNQEILAYLWSMHPDVDPHELSSGQLMRLVMEDLDQERGSLHDGTSCPYLLPDVALPTDTEQSVLYEVGVMEAENVRIIAKEVEKRIGYEGCGSAKKPLAHLASKGFLFYDTSERSYRLTPKARRYMTRGVH